MKKEESVEVATASVPEPTKSSLKLKMNPKELAVYALMHGQGYSEYKRVSKHYGNTVVTLKVYKSLKVSVDMAARMMQNSQTSGVTPEV